LKQPSQVRSAEKAKQQRKTANANLSQLEALNRAKAYIVPKDSPLAPQIADKVVKPARKLLYGFK
jgi:hypothetical protein